MSLPGVQWAPFVGQDVRQRRCVGCGGSYLPPGAGAGMCSDRCFVASRGRREGRNAGLARTVQAMEASQQRGATSRARVDRALAGAAQENDIAAWRRDRTEAMALISRLRSRSDPYAGYATRTALPDKCTGPDCPVCREGQRLKDAQRARRGGREITRTTDADGMGQLGTLYGEAVR